MHLLALLIEVVSIKVAGRQIKKPIDIPRPGKKGKGGQSGQNRPQRPAPQEPQKPQQQQGAGAPDPYKQGVAVLMASRFKRK